MEGDPQRPGLAAGLARAELFASIRAALKAGVRKVKFLGGEPLVRRDLPEIVAAARAEAPDADLSVITSGVGPLAAIEALFQAGLDRMNVSIHGWGLERFELHGGTPAKRERRQAVLAELIRRGRPTKLNYVYTGPDDDQDLAGLLAWAAGQPVVVSVLDDLGAPDAGPDHIVAALTRLHGGGWSARREVDPDSLDTTRLYWPDGLVVEVKTAQLGAVAPWSACATCPARARCREGIYAIRLTHDGRLRPCMDRPDVSWPLRDWAANDGVDAASQTLRTTLQEALA